MSRCCCRRRCRCRCRRRRQGHPRAPGGISFGPSVRFTKRVLALPPGNISSIPLHFQCKNADVTGCPDLRSLGQILCLVGLVREIASPLLVPLEGEAIDWEVVRMAWQATAPEHNFEILSLLASRLPRHPGIQDKQHPKIAALGRSDSGSNVPQGIAHFFTLVVYPSFCRSLV